MMAERNAALPEAKRILDRIGVNLGDVLIEGDDILGDGVNIAARLEGIASLVRLLRLGLQHVRGRIGVESADLESSVKNIVKPVRAYALPPDAIAAAKVEAPETARVSTGPTPSAASRPGSRLWCCPSPISAAIQSRTTSSMV